VNIKPMRNCIFVRPDQVVDQTDSGIVFSDFTKKRPTSGTILAIGTTVDKNEFYPGMRIIYGQFCGEKKLVNVDGTEEELFLMTEEDILAIEE